MSHFNPGTINILATMHITASKDPEHVLQESKCRKELEYAFQLAKE